MGLIREYTERAKHLGQSDMVTITFKEYRGNDVVVLVDLCPNAAVRISTPTCSCGSKKDVKHRQFNYMGTMLNPELCIDCWWEFLYEHQE